MSDPSQEKVSTAETVRIVWNLFTRKDRVAFVRIVLLIVVGTLLEGLSLGVVVPVVAVLTQEDYKQKYPFLVEIFGELSREEMIAAVVISMVFIYVLRSLFLIYILLVRRKFTVSLFRRLSTELFSRYLSQPYEFHLQRNSSTLIRNVRNANSVITSGVDPFFVLLSDGLVSVFLLCLLLYFEFVGTLLTVLIFTVFTGTFQLVTSKKIDSLGAQYEFHETKLIQQTQEGLDGVKEIKVLGREGKALASFGDRVFLSSQAIFRYRLLLALPRMYLEIMTISAIAFLVMIMLARESRLENIVGVLALFAAVAFRVMPSINGLIIASQTLFFNRTAFALVHDDLQLKDYFLDQEHKNSPFANSLELHDVSFQYPTAARTSLQNVSLVVRRGEAVGFVGPSGAGKSTLVDVILGLFAPTAGEVRVDGHNIQENLRNWQNQIGYVPQSIYLTDDTLRRNVAFGLSDENIDDKLVAEAIRLAQLDAFVESLPDRLETVVGERGVRLSGGQRQRIGIARALYHNPSVLVLDEATSSLDTPTEHGVMQAVQALQGTKTVIIVAHRLSTVEYCDRLYRIEDSRITEEGTFAEVVKPASKQ